MALTINRNNEISNKERQSLKEMFNERSFTRALYKSVKFLVHDFPVITKELDLTVSQLKSTSTKYGKLSKAFQVKQKADKEIVSILSSKK